MKKLIGLSLFLTLITGLLTSCLKTKFYEGSTTTSDNTINIVSSNGIPTNINFSVTQTQYVQGATFEIKASNAIPVELFTSTNPITAQVTNPITLQLTQAQAIQAILAISNVPIKFENINFGGAVALQLDPSIEKFFSKLSSASTTQMVVGLFGHTNQFISTAQINVPLGFNIVVAAVWFFILFCVGSIGRLISYLLIPRPAERILRLHKDLIKDLLASSPEPQAGGKSSTGAEKAEGLVLIDILAGGLASMLVPAFMRIFPGSSGLTALDDTSQIITLVSLALLAGIVGVEFIRGMAGLLVWLLLSIKRKGEEHDLEDMLKKAKEDLSKCNQEKSELESKVRQSRSGVKILPRED